MPAVVELSDEAVEGRVASTTPDRQRPRSPSRWLRGRFTSWVFATDHKRIGVTVALASADCGRHGGDAGRLHRRCRRQRPTASVIGEGTYASVLTMEETLLQYFVLVPLVIGLAVYLVPLHDRRPRDRAPERRDRRLLARGVRAALAVVLSPFGSGDAPRSWWTTVPPLALDPARGSEESAADRPGPARDRGASSRRSRSCRRSATSRRAG